MAGDLVPQHRRRCVLCGQAYRNCICVCTVCGTKKWTLTDGEWKHHVFYGGRW